MTFLRNLATDLVEKKLWPIAAALVVALVAIPIALGGSGSTPAPPVPPPAAAAPPAGAGAAIAVAAAQEGARDRGGAVHDPFVQPEAPGLEAAKDAVADAVEKAVTPESSGSTPAPGGTTGPADAPGTAPKPSTPSKPAPKSDPGDPVDDVYRVSVRFGTPAAQRRSTDLQPLTALPNSENPVLVFLGVVVRDGKRRARFLVSSDVEPSGDGRCKPSKNACEALELNAGDVALLDRTLDDGEVRQYRLDVVSLRREGADGKVLSAKAESAAEPEEDVSRADVRDDAVVTAQARLAAAQEADDSAAALYWWWIAVALELQRQQAEAAKALAAGDPRPAQALAEAAGWVPAQPQSQP